MKATRLEKALAVLSGTKNTCVGMDPSRVADPVELLMRRMKVSRTPALSHLKELELRGVVRIYKEGTGSRIGSVRVLKDTLPEEFHEEDEDVRCVRALWEYRRTSQTNLGQQIVHATQFDLVRRHAGMLQARFYKTLGRFEEYGWIRIIRKGRNKLILYVALTEKFPHNE